MDAPDSIRTQSPGTNVDQRDSAGSATAMIVDNSKLLPWFVVSYFISGVAISISMLMYFQYEKTEREFRILQLVVEDGNAILIREGLKQPTDTNHGPGNYQYDPNYRKKP
jgi:hypothetical protein